MKNSLRGRHLHLFGPGYSALAVAVLVQAEGAKVSATIRDPARMPALAEAGIRPLAPGETPQGVTDLLVSAPPGPEGCPAHDALAATLPKLTWAGYFSSTAVYGDCGGSWIDETAPVNPRSADARGRLLAESQWRDAATARGFALDLLRIAGIYGPEGRNYLAQLRAGTARAIVKPGQVFNRIHRADIAGAILAAMRAPAGQRLTNLSDGHPCAASDVLIGVAGMLGLPRPPEVSIEKTALSSGASFYAENGRLRNDRLHALLDFTLRYPDWRAGYSAMIAAGG
jgi:dTDP-4-dehydrorhamnose reductase